MSLPIRALAALVSTFLLAACQAPLPPAPEPGKTTRVGDTTITTSGRVFMETTYVD